MRLNFRQGIVRHQIDELNNQQFLDLVNGFVNLNVSPDPTLITFAHGQKNYLYTERQSIPNAWGPFDVGTDYWLYWDLNPVTGERSFGSTTLEPVETSNPPTNPVAGQMWFNTITTTMYEYSGASWVEVIRVFACKLENGVNIVSMSINAPDFRGTQVGITGYYRSGAIAFDTSGKPIRTGDRKFFTTEDIFVTGVPSGASLRVNNILVPGIAQQPLAAFMVVEYSDFNKLVPANPYTQGTKLFGIIEEDVDTGGVVNFVTEGVIYNEQWDWTAQGVEVNDPIYIDNTGQLTLTQFIPNQLPVGVIIGNQEILFSPRIFPQVTVGGPGGIQEFTALIDTPVSYTGYAANYVTVNSTEDGLEFSSPPVTNWGEIQGTLSNQSDLWTELEDAVSKSNTTTMNSNIDIVFNGGEVLGLPNIPSQQDAAASKEYVDSQVQGLIWRDPIVDPNIVSLASNNPPLTPDQGETFIIGNSPSNAWVTFAPGTVVTWTGTGWIDVLSRPVAVGDRFGITLHPNSYPSPNLDASLISYQGQIITITNNTPESITFDAYVPEDKDAVFIDNQNSEHFGHALTFSGQYGTGNYGTEYKWVVFIAQKQINAGTNLEYSDATTLNVGPQGIGSNLDADLWDGMQSCVTNPQQGQTLTWNSTSNCWENTTISSGGGLTPPTGTCTYMVSDNSGNWIETAPLLLPEPSDITFDYLGPVPNNNQIVFKFMVPRNMTLLDYGTWFNVENSGGPTSGYDVFEIRKGNVSGPLIGEISVKQNNSPIIDITETELTAGDILYVLSPTSPDATTANISCSLYGYRLPPDPACTNLSVSFSSGRYYDPSTLVYGTDFSITGTWTHLEWAVLEYTDDGVTWHPLDNGYTINKPGIGISLTTSHTINMFTNSYVNRTRVTQLSGIAEFRPEGLEYRVRLTVFGPSGKATATTIFEFSGSGGNG